MAATPPCRQGAAFVDGYHDHDLTATTLSASDLASDQGLYQGLVLVCRGGGGGL